jgi:hypothetical protein
MALITPVQYTGARSAGVVGSQALAFTSGVTAGNVLVVVSGCWSTRDVATPPTDTQGNTYTERSSSTTKIRWWTATALSTGACTVTVTLQSGLTEWMAMGIAELPAGTYTYSYSGFTSDTDASPSTGSLPVTVNGAALFAFLTCQGNNGGTLTEDGAWTSISKAATYNPIPYSFMFRNGNIGAYTGDWTAVGGGITTYRSGLVIEGTPTPIQIIGSHVFGAYGTVTTTRTGLINLDGVTRSVAGSGIEFVGGSVFLIEQGTAPAGIANTAIIYAVDSGAGKTKWMVQFPTGAAQQLSIEV